MQAAELPLPACRKNHSENNLQMVPYRGSQPRRGGRGPRGQANISRGFDEDYRSYDDREYTYDNYNPPNSRTHFSRSHDTLPASDFLTDPRETTAQLTVHGMFEAWDLKALDMDFPFWW